MAHFALAVEIGQGDLRTESISRYQLIIIVIQEDLQSFRHGFLISTQTSSNPMERLQISRLFVACSKIDITNNFELKPSIQVVREAEFLELLNQADPQEAYSLASLVDKLKTLWLLDFQIERRESEPSDKSLTFSQTLIDPNLILIVVILENFLPDIKLLELFMDEICRKFAFVDQSPVIFVHFRKDEEVRGFL